MEFSLNAERCVRCGLCVAECPTGYLVMTEEGPKPNRGGCLQCGHCVAVCPTEAIDSPEMPRAEQMPMGDYKRLSPEEAEKFLRSRRSIRTFKNTPVPKELLTRLVDVARMAPTATNSQNVGYHIVTNPDRLKRISQEVLDWMHFMGKKNARMRLYARGADLYTKQGKDFILHKAPALIVAHVPEKMFDRGHDSAHFCLAYAELFAPSLGLGTCWSGFAEYCGQYDWEPFLKELNLPEGRKVGGAIMVGYPQYQYRYMPNRRPLDVTFNED